MGDWIGFRIDGRRTVILMIFLSKVKAFEANGEWKCSLSF